MIDEELKGKDFTTSGLEEQEYDNCRFVDCALTSCDLSNISFIECTFEGCDLSMVKLDKTALKDVQFVNCKLLGVHFDQCNPFLLEMRFSSCQLDMASFYQMKMKGSRFTQCQLKEVDFTGAELTQASFDNCDLLHAVFDQTLLERADFRTAYNYIIDPEANYITGAKFASEGLFGLLQRYRIEVE